MGIEIRIITVIDEKTWEIPKCPFLDTEFLKCRVDLSLSLERMLSCGEEDDDDEDDIGNYMRPIPKGCPLRSGNITVILAKKEK